VHLPAGVGLRDLLLEGPQELLAEVPVVAGVDHLAGGDLQGGEQGGGAVPEVVGTGLLWQARPQRQDGRGRSSAWIWDLSSTQSTTALASGCR
jgi:hypothetical protein